MKDTLLKANNLSKTIGKQSILEQITFDVSKGEFFVILGENGVGKSTLLNIIASIDNNYQGEIEYTGKSVGMVFQSLALFPHMTVTENILFSLDDKTDNKQRLDEVLDLFRIRTIRNKYPHQLSGGERQKVAIARSIAPKPELLLLDEPFAAIDEGVRADIAFNIKSILKNQGITTILVTHKQEEALSLADRIAILDDKKITQIGTPQQIYDQPNNIKIAKFIGFMNFIHSEIKKDKIITPIGSLKYNKDSNNIHHCDIQGSEVQAKKQTAIIGIRPENLTITKTLKGNSTIKGVRYYGHDTDILIETDTKKRLTLTVRILGGSETNHLKFEVGEKVEVSFNENCKFVVF